MDNNATKSN